MPRLFLCTKAAARLGEKLQIKSERGDAITKRVIVENKSCWVSASMQGP